MSDWFSSTIKRVTSVSTITFLPPESMSARFREQQERSIERSNNKKASARLRNCGAADVFSWYPGADADAAQRYVPQAGGRILTTSTPDARCGDC